MNCGAGYCITMPCDVVLIIMLDSGIKAKIRYSSKASEIPQAQADVYNILFSMKTDSSLGHLLACHFSFPVSSPSLRATNYLVLQPALLRVRVL